MYIWQGFRRQVVCTNLRLSVQICVPIVFKQSEHFEIMTIIYHFGFGSSRLGVGAG
jgi:hypothetical protein